MLRIYKWMKNRFMNASTFIKIIGIGTNVIKLHQLKWVGSVSTAWGCLFSKIFRASKFYSVAHLSLSILSAVEFPVETLAITLRRVNPIESTLHLIKYTPLTNGVYLNNKWYTPVYIWCVKTLCRHWHFIFISTAWCYLFSKIFSVAKVFTGITSPN